jgi:hypothetical protein
VTLSCFSTNVNTAQLKVIAHVPPNVLYSRRKITASFVDMWEGGEDRMVIAHGEREPNLFLVLYNVKQLR